MLENFNIFDFDSIETVSWIKSSWQIESYAKGSILIEACQSVSDLYILKTGKLSVKALNQDSSKYDVTISELGKGSLIGDMSFLENKSPSSQVECTEDCSFYKCSFSDIREKIALDYKIGCGLYKLLSMKLALQVIDQNNLALDLDKDIAFNIQPLRKVFSFFCKLTDRDVNWIYENSTLLRLSEQECLITQGSTFKDIYLILSGTANIFINSDADKQIIGIAKRGEMIGEISFLRTDSVQASATVVASSDSLNVLAIPKSLIIQKITSEEDFGCRFYCGLSTMLSIRNREQLYQYNLAQSGLNGIDLTSENDELIEIDQLYSISSASYLFDWLCKMSTNMSEVIIP